MKSRFAIRFLALLAATTLALVASGCEATVGVGVGVGYPYGPYGPWGPGPVWVGGPVYR